MPEMRSLEAVSPWLAEPCDIQPPLDGDLDTDAAIIGGGFTGLSSALALRREGLSVAVLEANAIGYGASGRNAGHLTPTIGKDLPTLSRLFGAERVHALLDFTNGAVRHAENLIRSHEIACDYEPVGNIIAAVHPRQHRSIDKAAEVAARYGVAGKLLESEEMERRGLPRAFTRGFLEPHGGILNPGKYVRGLGKAALDAGAAIFEESPVTAIEQGSRPTVRTAAGTVRCRFVVIATNAYTPALGRWGANAVRLQNQLFRTDPLSDDQVRAVDWRGREGVYTAHEALESYRWTADNRIVGGAKFVRYGYANRALPDTDPKISTELERVFRQRFPELRDVRIDRHWGGPIFMGLDFLPSVGRTGKHNNVLYSLAYAGHGIAHAGYAGEMVADLIAERDGPGRALWSRRPWPLPPEPVRWLTVNVIDRLLAVRDRRCDRLAAGRK